MDIKRTGHHLPYLDLASGRISPFFSCFNSPLHLLPGWLFQGASTAANGVAGGSFAIRDLLEQLLSMYTLLVRQPKA